MDVLINFASLLPNPTGLSTYGLNLMPHLAPLDFGITSPTPIAPQPWYPCPTGMSAKDGARGHLRRLAWTQWQLPRLYRQLAPRLLFSPVPEMPLWQNIPTVVTVHDLIPLRFFPRTSAAYLYARYYLPRVLHQARHILCNSQATAADVQQFCHIPADRLTVIPLAHDRAHFYPRSRPTQNYFLALGRIVPYKNPERLIAAFAQLPQRQDYALQFAGPVAPAYRAKLVAIAAEQGVAAQVTFLDYVPDDELPERLSQAIGLVFPSLWEGFGLPVLEAMACGTPVITANLASLPEVTGDAALLVDPYDVAAISQAMQRLITEPGLRTHLRQAGLARSQQFSWAKTGAATAAVLQQFLQ